MSGSKIGGLHIAGAYIGSMIGAGFASGQEHLQFFVNFGAHGRWGIGLAGVLLTLCGGLILHTAQQNQTTSHQDLLRVVCADGPVAPLFDIVLTVTMLTSISVMMAGGGALVSQFWGGPLWVGSAALGMSAALVVALGLERMLHVNGVLTIALTVLIILVALRASAGGVDPAVSAPSEAPFTRASWVPSSWYLSSLLYVAYSLTFAFSFFGALGADIRTRRDAWAGGFSGGALLTLLGIAVCTAVSTATQARLVGELPMLTAAAMVSPVVEVSYVFVIWAAMLTTAIAGTFALARRTAARLKANPWYLGPLVVAAATPLSGAGFSKLVGTAYPLTGYVGAGCLLMTLLHLILRDR